MTGLVSASRTTSSRAVTNAKNPATGIPIALTLNAIYFLYNASLAAKSTKAAAQSPVKMESQLKPKPESGIFFTARQPVLISKILRKLVPNFRQSFEPDALLYGAALSYEPTHHF